MKDAVRVFEVEFGERAKELRAVRFTVFVEEQKVPAELEMDEWDARSRHVLAMAGEDAIGTGRLLPDGHIGRVAVLKEWRGKGVGEQLMKELMRLGELAGMRKFVLSAQVQAVPFYQRLGFSTCGDVYEEAGIPHREMVLRR